MGTIEHESPLPGRARLSGALGAILVLVLIGVLVGQVRERVRAAGWERIDPGRVELLPAAPGAWADPRWEASLRATLRALGPFEARDEVARARAVETVAAMPFVLEAGDARTVWPDGLDLPVRLRRAVACVRVRGQYLVVSEDAVVLPGPHPVPPYGEGGWLPVIGPLDGAFDDARPGDALAYEHHLDALAVASSLSAHLAPGWRDALGRIVIDASTSRATSVTEHGTRLLLEDARVVLFGRSPRQDAPGELPVARKWDHLARALACLRSGRLELDLETVAVRWDEVTDRDVLWRDGGVGALPTWDELAPR